MITASIFGPLAFMPVEATRSAISALFPETIEWTEQPSAIDLEFWQSLRTQHGGTVEPDLIVQARWQDGTEHLICVEVKWNSGFSDRQSRFQWDALSAVGKAFTHYLLVRDRPAALAHVAECFGEAMRCPYVVTWSDLLERLLALQYLGSRNPLSRWADSVRLSLKILGEKLFEGFRFDGAEQLSEIGLTNPFLFERRFNWPDEVIGDNSRWSFAEPFSWPTATLTRLRDEAVFFDLRSNST